MPPTVRWRDEGCRSGNHCNDDQYAIAGDFINWVIEISIVGLALFVTAATGCASAATMEQAMAQCREQLTPAVRGCVRAKVMANQGSSPDQYIPGCRAQFTAPFKACVAKLIGAAGFKNHRSTRAKSLLRALRRLYLGHAVFRPGRSPISLQFSIRKSPIRCGLRHYRRRPMRSEPSKSDPVALAHFYFGRAVVRSELGRTRDAVTDGERAIQLATGKVDQLVLSAFRNTVALQHLANGDPKQALTTYLAAANDGERGTEKGWLFSIYRQIVILYLTLGDFDRAQSYVQKVEALWKTASSVRGYADHGPNWQASVEDAKARLFEARGQLEDALKSYQRAEALRRGNVEKAVRAMISSPRTQLEQAIDLLLLSSARVKSRLGRIAEGESDARRALLSRLRATGKYAPATARYIATLGVLLVEQGRYEEAKRLIAATIDIYRSIGMPEDTQTFVTVMNDLASVQALQGQWHEANASYASIERGTANWEPRRRGPFLNNLGRIETLYRNDRVEEGLAVGRRLLEFRTDRYGEQIRETALARGLYAVGLALAKRDDDARREFQASVPLLTATTFNTDNDDVLNAAARTRYTQIVVENYIALLVRLGPSAGPDVTNDTFRLADSIRSRSVQKALTAASARMNTSDPKLALALRQEQDLR